MPAFILANFQPRWQTFLLRRTLVLHDRLGRIAYVGGSAVPIAVEIPPLPQLIVSLLYLDLASLLDESSSRTWGTSTTESTISRRRGMYSQQQVSAAEFSHALEAVHRQLEAWQLVAPMPAYDFFHEEWTEEPTGPEGSKKIVRVGVKHKGGVIHQHDSMRYFDAD